MNNVLPLHTGIFILHKVVTTARICCIKYLSKKTEIVYTFIHVYVVTCSALAEHSVQEELYFLNEGKIYFRY